MSEPSRSTPVVDDLIGLFLTIKADLGRHIAARGDMACTPLAISLLELIDRMPDCSQKALAERTGRDKAQIARMVRDLEQDGLLTRTPSPRNSRHHLLAVTPAAGPYILALEAAKLAAEARLLAGLDEGEREMLAALLARMRAHAQADAPQGP
ncbi:MAG: MarR family winged helix-turn-helix transcriptional regulator [Pigmentiphaga sp.]|uniref:MarR family winged helix-turn-helix transcriptional regulator n=1 Tax=Pigmentiphaga sp. TaxID=1977564 RepID=UPI0029AEE5F1|nr:MarR family winged helix-turn-helix transcriptional regulator [Pigmentiphaga sp.]MDX3904236.1 MarR family winged helix-turn-helix transcriptional regulator [Pigmentiphaga sp.]